VIAYFVQQPFLKHKRGDVLKHNPGQNWLDRGIVSRIVIQEPKLEREEHPHIKPRQQRVPSFERYTPEEAAE